MRKTLVYVDAENVSKEGFVNAMKDVVAASAGTQMLGKFYGGKDEISGLMPLCYSYGLDYVETSSLVTRRKNVADMKICVDCLCDTLITYCDDVETLYLLSSDCDFVPLYYKLIGNGINVSMPLLSSALSEKTLGDLENELHNVGYDPLLENNILVTQYPRFRELLDDAYSDTLLTAYFERKRKKFLKAIVPYTTQEAIEELQGIDVALFDFTKVYKVLNLNSCDSRVWGIMDLYTRKFFGVSYTLRQRTQKLQEILYAVA